MDRDIKIYSESSQLLLRFNFLEKTLALREIEAGIIYLAEIAKLKVQGFGSFPNRTIASWCCDEEFQQAYELRENVIFGNMVQPLRRQARTIIRRFEHDAKTCEGNIKLLDLYYKAAHDLSKAGHDCSQKLDLLAYNAEYIYTGPWIDYQTVYISETCLGKQILRLKRTVEHTMFLIPNGLHEKNELRERQMKLMDKHSSLTILRIRWSSILSGELLSGRGSYSDLAIRRSRQRHLFEECRQAYVELVRDVKAAFQASLDIDSIKEI